jgi:hypothetical protein
MTHVQLLTPDAKQDQHTTARRAESARQIVTATNNGSDWAVEFRHRPNDSRSYLHFPAVSVALRISFSGFNPESQNRGLMQIMLLCLGGWIAANLIIAGMWTAFRLWRARTADALMHSVFRRAL